MERFVYHFKDQRTNKTEQSVKDPRIIRFCNNKKWMLVTTDSSMLATHVEIIKETEVAILATAHNSAEDVGEWVDALILGKARFERYFKKHPRPSFATFNRQGQFGTVKTVSPDSRTRRNQPREAEQRESTHP